MKHRLQITGRAGDDLKDLRGRSLLLQRFSEIIRALAQLVEQPRVLDGDGCLIGEGLNEINLVVGERPDLLQVINYHDAQQLVAFEYRHRENCPDRFDVFHPP